MTELLNNISELIKMIWGVLIVPNYGTSDNRLTVLRWLYNPATASTPIRSVLLLSFGIMCLGGSIAIFRRFLKRD